MSSLFFLMYYTPTFELPTYFVQPTPKDEYGRVKA